MSTTSKPQPHALVVDDDETFVDQVTYAMHQLGFTVETSFDGLDALKRCQSSRFDIVLCDVRMPRLSGLSFLSNLARTSEPIPKVIMVSALDDNAIRRQALATGASAYLVKPVASQVLKDAIDTALGKP